MRVENLSATAQLVTTSKRARRRPVRPASLPTSQTSSLNERVNSFPWTLLKTIAIAYLALYRGAEATVVGGTTLQLANTSTTSLDGAQLSNLAIATTARYNGKSNLRIFNSTSLLDSFPTVSPFDCFENSVTSLSTGGCVVFGIDAQNRVIYQSFNALNTPGTVLTASTLTNTNITGLTCTRSGRLVAAWWADGRIWQRLFFNNGALTPNGAAETHSISVSNPTRPYLFSLTDPWVITYSNGTQVFSNIYSSLGFSNSITASANSNDTCVSPCGCQTTGGHVIIFAKINPTTREILGYFFRRNNNVVNIDTTDQQIASGSFGTWDGDSQIVDVTDNSDGTFTVNYLVINDIYQVVVNSTSGVIIEPASQVSEGSVSEFSMTALAQEGQGRWATLWSNATGIFSSIFSRITVPPTTVPPITVPPTTVPPTTVPPTTVPPTTVPPTTVPPTTVPPTTVPPTTVPPTTVPPTTVPPTTVPPTTVPPTTVPPTTVPPTTVPPTTVPPTTVPPTTVPPTTVPPTTVPPTTVPPTTVPPTTVPPTTVPPTTVPPTTVPPTTVPPTTVPPTTVPPTTVPPTTVPPTTVPPTTVPPTTVPPTTVPPTTVPPTTIPPTTIPPTTIPPTTVPPTTVPPTTHAMSTLQIVTTVSGSPPIMTPIPQNLVDSQSTTSSKVVEIVAGTLGAVFCLAASAAGAFAFRWFRRKSNQANQDVAMELPRSPPTPPLSFSNRSGSSGVLNRPPVLSAPLPRRSVTGTSGGNSQDPIYNNLSAAFGGQEVDYDLEHVTDGSVTRGPPPRRPVLNPHGGTVAHPIYNNLSTVLKGQEGATAEDNYQNVDEAVQGMSLPVAGGAAGRDTKVIYAPFSALYVQPMEK
jgi:YD repeat-containing protein